MKTFVAAGLCFVLSTGFAAAQERWQLVGQLEMDRGERVGPLTVSPMGELVAGSLWDAEQEFRGRVWTLSDGIAIADLDAVFPSLLPIRFAQRAYDPQTMSARVYAHSRRSLRSWALTGGAPVLDLTFESDVLANDALFDGFRQTFIVSASIGPLWVYSAAGEALGVIETDAMRPHGAMTLSADGEELVVNSSAFTLTGQMDGIPYQCTDGSCQEAYAQLPGSYGPYEELLAVNPARQWLATLAPIDPEHLAQAGGTFHPVAEPTVRLWANVEAWDTDTPPMLTLTGFRQPVRAGEFSADGQRLLTLDTGNDLAVWNVETGARELALEEIITAHFIPDSKTLFVHRADGASMIVAIGEGRVVQTFPDTAEDAVIAPDGQVLITYSPGQQGPARVWRRQ